MQQVLTSCGLLPSASWVQLITAPVDRGLRPCVSCQGRLDGVPRVWVVPSYACTLASGHTLLYVPPVYFLMGKNP